MNKLVQAEEHKRGLKSLTPEEWFSQHANEIGEISRQSVFGALFHVAEKTKLPYERIDIGPVIERAKFCLQQRQSMKEK